MSVKVKRIGDIDENTDTVIFVMENGVGGYYDGQGGIVNLEHARIYHHIPFVVRALNTEVKVYYPNAYCSLYEVEKSVKTKARVIFG